MYQSPSSYWAINTLHITYAMNTFLYGEILAICFFFKIEIFVNGAVLKIQSLQL